jgi:hypothetical protein
MDTWDLYFISIFTWQLHPGYCRSPDEKLSAEQCAELTNKLMEVRKKWRGLDQSLEPSDL